MPKINAENERMKHEYFGYERDARQKSEATIDAMVAALHRFDDFFNQKSYRKFRHHVAQDYKRWLSRRKNQKTGSPLSKATQRSELRHVKAFFQWLHGRPSYKSCFALTDANYFNLSYNDVRESLASSPRPFPTLEQVNEVLEKAAHQTVIKKRDRALIAFAAITGARIDALRTFKVRDVDIEAGSVRHDARHVHSKRRKNFVTTFVPIPGEAHAIFDDWYRFITNDLCFSPDDPLFPKTLMGKNEEGFLAPIGVKQEHWETQQPIRDIFKKQFEAAGLSYFHPHSFRHMLVAWVKAKRLSQAEWVAFSENIGHESPRTTEQSYGRLSEMERSRLVEGLANDDSHDNNVLFEMQKTIDKLRGR